MTRFRELRKKANLTQEELIAQFNARYGRKYTAAAISQFEHDKRIPATESLKDFADFFGVSIDYLLGREDAPAAAPAGPSLSARDERDIERRLDAIMNDLAPGTGLAFYDGQKLTDSERDLLRISLKNSMELVRSMAKERFTPKKYKK